MTGPLGAAINDVRRGVELAPVWWTLGWDQTVSRFRRTLLGPFWLAASLLATGLALTFVFGGLFGTDYRRTFPFIITGILAWSMVGSAATEGANAYLANTPLMFTQALPLSFYVFLVVQRLLINFLAQLVATWGVLLALGLAVLPSWQIIPGVLVALVACWIIGLVFSFPATRFRDVNYLTGFLMQFLFFLTPVFWAPTQIAAERRFIADYNPLAHLIEIIRQPLLGHAAAAIHWQWSFGLIGVLAVAGLLLLMTFRKRVVFWL